MSNSGSADDIIKKESIQKSRESKSAQNVTTGGESEKFSKDIVTTDFYVLDDDNGSAFQFETSTAQTTPKVSIIEPEKLKKDEPKEAVFDLTDSPTDEQEDVHVPEKSKETEELDTEFFEKVVDQDADKKQVVDEISGMTESAEIEDEVEETDIMQKEPVRPSTIQFRPPDKIAQVSEPEPSVEIEDSKKSLVEQEFARASMARRTSGLPELMKLSRRSLIALSSSFDPGASRKSSTYRKEVEGEFGIGTSGADLYDRRQSRMTAITVDSRRSTRRSTALYGELGPRIRQTEEEDLLAGFDIGGDAPIFFDDVQEEEEHISIAEEEEQPALERAPFYERHDIAVEEIIVRKLKSFILQKKMAMYFKRKKMDYVTKETDWSFDLQTKYFRKLEGYGDLIDFVKLERARVNQDIEDTKQKRTKKYEDLTKMFKKMQDREGEIGYGLINTKTGNALPDKFVERLIRRQNIQMTQVSSMRLTYIRLKDMVQEKLNAISNLDEIAPGFLLAEYEQLKSDNRAYADKIEEKDEELTRLRSKCGSTIQILAHLREKTSALENDLDDLIDERDISEQYYSNVRRLLNQKKQDRDNVRHMINKMRDESGLLTQPTLLKDMESGIAEEAALSKQLSQLVTDYKKRAKKIKTIRKKIEESADLRRGMSKKSLLRVRSNAFRSPKKDISSQVYRGRPTLIMPVIENSAFDDLRAIKPKITYDRSHRNHPSKLCKRKEG